MAIEKEGEKDGPRREVKTRVSSKWVSKKKGTWKIEKENQNGITLQVAAGKAGRKHLWGLLRLVVQQLVWKRKERYRHLGSSARPGWVPLRACNSRARCVRKAVWVAKWHWQSVYRSDAFKRVVDKRSVSDLVSKASLTFTYNELGKESIDRTREFCYF